MKGLFIIPYIPYPLDSGGNQAFFSMIEYLKKSIDIHIIIPVFRNHVENFQALEKIWTDVSFHPYYFLKDPAEPLDELKLTEEEKAEYNSRFFDLITYFYGSFKRKIKRYRKHHPREQSPDRLVREHTSLSAFNPFLAEGFLRHVQQTSFEGNYDFIQVEFFELLPLYKFLPGNCKKIFVHHELRFVRLENELELFDRVNKEDELAAEGEKLKELAMLNKYDIVITLTETDKKILSEYIPKEKIIVSPAVIHIPQTEDARFKECVDGELVFIGGNAHFPNWDGVNWFCEEVLPELRKLVRRTRIRIVGNWTEKAQNKYSKECPEVVFEGFVRDLSPILSGRISIVPIRIGSGMRMKILESVNLFSPFVTTSKGVEGQNFIDGQDCLIADDAKSFAKALAKLCEDVELQRKLATNAKAKLKKIYRPEDLLSKRAAIYDSLH